jgi:O-antigen/teichoic acid export membrane protein
MSEHFGRDLVRYLPGQMLLGIIAFISVPILTHILSPAHFGYYALVGSSVAIAVSLFGSLPMGIIRFYPAARGDEVEILVRTSFWSQVILVGGLAVVLLGLSRFLWPSNGVLQRLFDVGIWIVFLQAIFLFLVEVLRASRRVGEYNWFNIWSKSFGLVSGLVLAVYFDLGVFGMLWGIVLGFATALPVLWQRVFMGKSAIGPVSLPLVRDVAGFGIPLVIGNFGAWVLRNFDRYLILSYFGAKEAGIYSAAYSIGDHSIALVAALFALSSTPLLTNVWEQEGREASQRVLSSVTRVYLLVGIPAVVGLSVLAEPVMTVLTGGSYSDGYPIIPWVVGGSFLLGLQQRFNQVLKLVKRTPEIMFWITFTGSINIGLNCWLLPVFGYQIAAWNTFLCYAILCVGQGWSSRRHFQWPFPWWTGLRSGLAAGVMLGSVLVLKHALSLSGLSMLCVGVPTGMLVYMVSVWLLGEVSLMELKALEIGRGGRIARETAEL